MTGEPVGERAPVLLLADDDDRVHDLVAELAVGTGFRVVACPCRDDVLGALRRTPVDLALVGLQKPDTEGIELLGLIRRQAPTCDVVLVTSAATVAAAIEAIRLGARDYLSRPLDRERLRRLLEDVRAQTRCARQFGEDDDTARPVAFHGMLGRSPVMQETFGLMRRLAPHARAVLITGETGTGKDLAARGLHREGPRRAQPFVCVNCSAVVDTLAESELFGHAGGAFTGASTRGVFGAADGGVVFFDEIGELPLTVQGMLLRVLERGEIRPVGASEAGRVDVVVLAATNRDLAADVEAGRFRRDLFYRINAAEVHLPPLRDRPEDIPYLTAVIVRECADRLRKPLMGVTPAAERILESVDWPGNVRELRHAIECACLLTDGRFVTDRELAGLVGPGRAIRDLASRTRDHIAQILREVGGNKTEAAVRLGVSRRALYRRLERHRLSDEISRRARP